MPLDTSDTKSYLTYVTVSKVREGLTKDRLGPLWATPAHTDSPKRAEAVAWARRQLAWERRLAAIQDARTRADDQRPLDIGHELVAGGAQTAQGE
jgi:hypothetical protein